MLQGGSSGRTFRSQADDSQGAICSVPWFSAQTAQGSLRAEKKYEGGAEKSSIHSGPRGTGLWSECGNDQVSASLPQEHEKTQPRRMS